MKKYSICFLLSACLLVVISAIGGLSLQLQKKEKTESLEPVTLAAVETTEEGQEIINQIQIENKIETTQPEQYYLVVEDGFLLVFSQDQSTICLYTHMPIIEFPVEEQEKLREGIWFPSMLEVLNYLESHSS